MKMLKLFGLAGFIALIATGCTTVNTNDGASDSKQVMVPAVYEPVIKHVDTKVAGEASQHAVFGLIKWGDSSFADRVSMGKDPNESLFSSLFGNPEKEVKAAAVYNACKTAKCDLLLSTKYEVTVTNYVVYKVMRCRVSGYPGTEVGVVKKDITYPHSLTGATVVPLVPLN